MLVSANFKLSFDSLRWSLKEVDCWLLVLDTRGINVWCAAGKGSFGSDELVYSVNAAGLAEVVEHRELIVPQLGAPGVDGAKVRKESGFKVVYGPVRADDIKKFLEQNSCDEKMRSVTFNLAERAILIPVELYLTIKPLLITLVILFIISGIGPNLFSFTAALARSPFFIGATLLGVVSGAIATPLLLPLLPWRQFWLKGVIVGGVGGVISWWLLQERIQVLETIAFLSWSTTIASYLAMNFTGATPFTSPSGVEYEMRRGLPVQAGLTVLAAVTWITTPFIR